MKQAMLILLSCSIIWGQINITRSKDTLLSQKASLNVYISSLGDTVKTYAIGKSMVVASNLTTPKTAILGAVNNRATIHVNAGITLTIRAMSDDIPDSTFVGSGTVVIDTCAVSHFNKRWFSSSLTYIYRGCNGDTLKTNAINAKQLKRNDSTLWGRDDLTGDRAEHYHASDRSRSNHTGTQLSTTISDFASAVLSAGASAWASISNVFGHLTDGRIPCYSASIGAMFVNSPISVSGNNISTLGAISARDSIVLSSAYSRAKIWTESSTPADPNSVWMLKAMIDSIVTRKIKSTFSTDSILGFNIKGGSGLNITGYDSVSCGRLKASTGFTVAGGSLFTKFAKGTFVCSLYTNNNTQFINYGTVQYQVVDSVVTLRFPLIAGTITTKGSSGVTIRNIPSALYSSKSQQYVLTSVYEAEFGWNFGYFSVSNTSFSFLNQVMESPGTGTFEARQCVVSYFL